MRCDCGETTKRDRELAEVFAAGLSRREMLRGSAVGFGYLALAALLADESPAQAAPAADVRDPLAPRPPHFPARRVPGPGSPRGHPLRP